MLGSYTEFEGGDLLREQDRGVHGDLCWGNILLKGGHPFDGGNGGRECDTRVGEEWDELDVDDEDKGRRRFFREKDCSAWEKWVGRGRATLDTVVSTATDIVERLFSSFRGRYCTAIFERKLLNRSSLV